MYQETLYVVVAMLAYGVFHSLTAAIGIKAVFAALMGHRAYLGFYRFFYNIVSAITLVPVFALMAAEPGSSLWALDGVVGMVFRLIQLLGALGVLISFLQIDSLRFAGLRQAAAYLNGDPLPLPEEPLSRNGFYRLVRHPLYFFGMMILWFNPAMSAAWLGFCIGSSAYFVIGSLLEERKLLRAFGEDYRSYQRQVAWMIPLLRRQSDNT